MPWRPGSRGSAGHAWMQSPMPSTACAGSSWPTPKATSSACATPSRVDALVMDAPDILAIHDLLARYGHVVADADWQRLSDVFTLDGVFDLEAIGRGHAAGLEELRAC